MSTHPSSEILSRYARQQCAPAELLEIDAHVTHCATCRAALWDASRDRRQRVEPLGAADDDPHASYDELQAVIDGTAGDTVAERVRRHCETCEMCDGERADLAAFADELRDARVTSGPVMAQRRADAPPPTARRTHRWRWVALSGVAASVMLAALLRPPASSPPSAGPGRSDAPVVSRAPVEPGPSPALPEAPATPAASAASPSAATRTPTASDVRRSGTRVVAGKTFRLTTAGWVDSAFDPYALLPEVRVGTDDAIREAVTARPALAPFVAMGPRVTVVLDGIVYRLGRGEP